ncbi:MAG: hypothetical protein AAFS10_14585 [Myxococcota bacterium]
MPSIPKRVLNGIPSHLQPTVLTWWNQLDRSEQNAIRSLYSPRWAHARYLPQHHGDGTLTWHPLMTQPYREDPHTPDPFPWDLFEYYHDRGYHTLMKERAYHICTAHPQARQQLGQGCIPSSFRCPLGRMSCPLRRIVRQVGRGASVTVDGHGLDLTRGLWAVQEPSGSAHVTLVPQSHPHNATVCRPLWPRTKRSGTTLGHAWCSPQFPPRN